MSLRRWVVSVAAAALILSVTFAAGGQVASDVVTLTLPRPVAETLLAALEEALATTTTTTTTLPPTTTTAATTTTTTTTTTVPPTTTTTAPPGACVGVQVAAGSNLVTVANANAAGTTFCLAGGTYPLTGSGMPLQNGDAVIGALGPNGERLSVLTGNDTATKAVTCTCSGGTVANIVIEHFNSAFQSQPVGPSMTNWLWDNIESRFNAARGIYTWTGSTLRNSYIHHNSQLGVSGAGSGILIEDNEIAFNNWEAEFVPGQEGGGTKWVDTTNLIVRNNFVHHNCGAGLWTDGNDNVFVLYENNTVEDNWGIGIFHELGRQALITGNTVSRNAFGLAGGVCVATGGGNSGGIMVSNSEDTEVAFNVLVGNDGGVYATEADRGANNPHVQNLNVHDNVSTYSVGWTGIQRLSGTFDPYTVAANNHFENNDYFTSRPFKWLFADRTWAEWQSYGHDETGSIS